MKKNINIEIALTHIITRKKQTLVAALGVTIGVAVYFFMNSMDAGFSKFSTDEIFKNSPQIKIYKDDEISKPFANNDKDFKVIINPQITTLSKKIINPEELLKTIKNEPYVTYAIAQVNFDAFYNRGKAQLRGNGIGANIQDYNSMFNTENTMVSGSIKDLDGNLNGIIIGNGIAEKLNLGLSDNITVSSSYGITKVLKIVGIFSSGNSITDLQKSYVNVSTAQQFIKEGPSFVSAIFINTLDRENPEKYVPQLQQLTNYKVEDWKTTSADVLTTNQTREAMMGAISFCILLISGFGIYNILSSTIMQKINDIAILKAIGFKGGDVIRIFVYEAVVMGLLGTLIGLGIGSILIGVMARTYMGPPVGYFPITFQFALFMKSFVLGTVITFCAGYFPARKAARVDPVEIFRK